MAERGNECRGKGLAVSVVDMLICAVAESRGWTVFTTDSDFARYATTLSFKLHFMWKPKYLFVVGQDGFDLVEVVEVVAGD